MIIPEALLSDVQFALRCQTDQDSAALDGDGRGVVRLAFFKGRVAEEWVREIRTELYRHQQVEMKRHPGSRWVKGVSLLEFHRWVANKVHRTDPAFIPPDDAVGWGFLSADMTASRIVSALSEWCGSH